MAEGLPEDLAEIRRGLEESDREARALLAELDEERFNWRPDERSWSVVIETHERRHLLQVQKVRRQPGFP